MYEKSIISFIMANNIDIKINSIPGYNKNLSRTSYDIHQEINANVIGVLKYNNDIRKKLLSRNIGKYSSVNLDEGIGYISSFYSNISNKPLSLGEDGLLGFTHITQSDYQQSLNKKYDIGDFIQYYRHGSTPDGNFLKWNGVYNDYTEYINEVFGFKFTSLNLLSNMFQTNKVRNGLNLEHSEETNLTIQMILNDILQYDNIKYAMEKSRIGTITPNPLAALDGAITTNINNFSGKDTPLGLITNHIYAHTLKNGAQFNSLRRTKYITPEVYEQIGNKLSTISTLPSYFRIDDETGRLAYEIGSDIETINYENSSISEIVNKVIDKYKDISDNNNARYRNLILNESYSFDGFFNRRYLPFNDTDDTYGDKLHGKYKLTKPRNLLYSFISPTINGKTYQIWNEGDNVSINNDINSSYIDNTYKGLSIENGENDLLEKTQNLFRRHDDKGIDTLIARFHTTGGRDMTHNETNLFQTAVSKFGLSHGRNLLNKQSYETGVSTKEENGYENPYCRTWTYHKQYSSINDLIRPFKEENSDIETLQANWDYYGRRSGSSSRLKDNSVLNKSGFVNITPAEESFSENDKYNVDVKKCMFSIENLAWKDVTDGIDKNVLSKEQIGPNGGRIMWFPPYGLKFNETVNVDWNPNEFIGRGEKIYTYRNTERSGTLSFMLLVDHPSILDMWKKNGASLNENDNEQQLLRFFAGCDTLTLDNKPIEPIEPNIDSTPDDIPVTPVTPEEKTIKDIVFYIFFSNNYTGYDNFDDALNYLTTNYETSNYKSVSNGKWNYKVDKYFENEIMKYKSNYKDLVTYNLNDNLESVKKEAFFKDATMSFKDFVESGISNNVIIESVTIQSFASSHGKEKTNKILYQRRNDFAEELLKNKLSITKDKINKLDGSEITVDDIDKANVSGESAKRARCSKVVLKVKQYPHIVEINDSTNEKTINDGETEVIKESESLTINNTIETNTGKLTRKQKRALKKQKKEFNAYMNDGERIRNSINEQLKTIKTTIDIQDNTKTIDDVIKDLQKSMPPQTRMISGSMTEMKRKEYEYFMNKKQERWDEEAQYFSMLKENDSFLYTRLVDKIKYFTPAFHSITPEGFNSRLAFLHQCTRQGLTMGTSDGPSKNENGYIRKSAGNLAFGRPPICVLRIGDFYYTRIIIESVTISYENTQWDMNTEGIGMQPMYAEISLNFKFLGGSDLSAPISRLQNAISFNYYANQSIYDNRADIGVYNNKNAVIQGKPWTPNNKK